MKKIKQPPLDEFTTDLAYSASKQKLLILPHRFPQWTDIKQQLKELTSPIKKTELETIQLVYGIIRLSLKEKTKLKGLESFCHFLDVTESGKLDDMKKDKGKEGTEEQLKSEVKPDEVQEQEEETKEKKDEESEEQLKQCTKAPHKLFQPQQITRSLFIEKTLPFVAQSALKIQEFFPEGEIQILQASVNKKVTFSKQQALCLLSHMFLCTLDNQERQFASTFFMMLKTSFKPTSYWPQKLLCIVYYFERMRRGLNAAHDIVIERAALTKSEYASLDLKAWTVCEMPLTDFQYFSGSMEEHSIEKSIEVDFANELIGGGVLSVGLVQEEILFLVVPECLVSLPICERMHSNEAIFLRGVERFTGYKGYKNSFQITEGIFEERKVPRVVTAINALKMGKTHSHLQFTPPAILRELNKAFIGFSLAEEKEKEKRRTVVTGKWGCGAFRGDPQLKLMIQWLAASKQGRDVVFCGFGDKLLEDSRLLVEKVLKAKLSVRELFKRVLEFCGSESAPQTSLFSYLFQMV